MSVIKYVHVVDGTMTEVFLNRDLTEAEFEEVERLTEDPVFEEDGIAGSPDFRCWLRIAAMNDALQAYLDGLPDTPKGIRIFRTAQDLIQWIAERFPKSETDERTDAQRAAWMICLQEARSLTDWTTKDLASLFYEGVAAFETAPEERIQGWLDTIYEDLNAAMIDGDVKLNAEDRITIEEAEMYGVMNLAGAISADFISR